MYKKKSPKKKLKTEIVVALIGLTGVLLAAIVTGIATWLSKPANNSNVNEVSADNSNIGKADVDNNNSQILTNPSVAESSPPENEPISKDDRNENLDNPEKSKRELIEILKARAESIVRTMEEQKRDALSSIRSGNGKIGEGLRGKAGDDKQTTVTDFVRELDATKQLFIELHQKHIEALQRGQLTLANDIASDIHYLLYVRHDKLVEGAYTSSYVRYGRFNFLPAAYSRIYPGIKPSRLEGKIPKLVRAVWPKKLNREVNLDHKTKIEEQLKAITQKP